MIDIHWHSKTLSNPAWLSAEHTVPQEAAASTCITSCALCTGHLSCARRHQKALTGSSQHVVGVCEAGEGTLVGGHTNILKDEGTVQEEEVVGVWGEGR